MKKNNNQFHTNVFNLGAFKYKTAHFLFRIFEPHLSKPAYIR